MSAQLEASVCSALGALGELRMAAVHALPLELVQAAAGECQLPAPELASLVERLHTRLEALLDAEVRRMVAGYLDHRDRVSACLHRVRHAAAADRRTYDTASRHREAEAIGLEKARLQDAYERDVRSKSEQLAESAYMTTLLTKEIYFLVERNTALGEQLDEERAKAARLETALEDLSRARPTGRIARRVRSPAAQQPGPLRAQTAERRASARTVVDKSEAAAPLAETLLEVALDSLPPPSPFPDPSPDTRTAEALSEEPPLADADPAAASPQPQPREEEHWNDLTPQLPPHLVPPSQVIDEELLLRAPVSDASEHERIKRTIEESRAVAAEPEGLSMRELMSRFNNQDALFVQEHVPPYHNPDTYSPPLALPVSGLALRHVAQLPVPRESPPLAPAPVAHAAAVTRGVQTDAVEAPKKASPHRAPTSSAGTQTESRPGPAVRAEPRHEPRPEPRPEVRPEVRAEHRPEVRAEARARRQAAPVTALLMNDVSGDNSIADDLSESTSASNAFRRRQFEVQRVLLEAQLENDMLRSVVANLERDVREGARRLAEAQGLSEARRARIDRLERDKGWLEEQLARVNATLVSKENTHTIYTHERDVLLRELSQQLFEAREAADQRTRQRCSSDAFSPARTRTAAGMDRRVLEAQQLTLPDTGLAPGAGMSSPGPPKLAPLRRSSAEPRTSGDGSQSRLFSAGARHRQVQSIAADLRQAAAEFKGCSPTTRKRGPDYYMSGPELLGATHPRDRGGSQQPALSEADVARLHSVRKAVVDRIVVKTAALKIHC